MTQFNRENLNALVWRTFAAAAAVDADGKDSLDLEHLDGQAGAISAEGVLELGFFRVVDLHTGEVTDYESIELLVLGGWRLRELSS
jgi:hypothetical protein